VRDGLCGVFLPGVEFELDAREDLEAGEAFGVPADGTFETDVGGVSEADLRVVPEADVRVVPEADVRVVPEADLEEGGVGGVF